MEFTCCSCGGKVRNSREHDIMWRFERGLPEVRISPLVLVPTCDTCGECYLGEAETYECQRDAWRTYLMHGPPASVVPLVLHGRSNHRTQWGSPPWITVCRCGHTSLAFIGSGVDCPTCLDFRCSGCNEVCPFELGAADDRSDLCDSCWSKAHKIF